MSHDDSVVFRLTIPTPWDKMVLIPTFLLFIVQLMFLLPWWTFLIPVVADLLFVALAVAVLNVVVFVHNFRVGRRVLALRRKAGR